MVCDMYYDEASNNATLSVIDLDTMDDLAAAMTVFSDALMANSAMYSSISSVVNSTQSFYYSENRDLKDFALGVAGMAGAPGDLVDAANALVAQLDISIAYNRNQSDYPGAYGMAIYLPGYNQGMDSGYTDSGAVWSQRTTWDEFLDDFAN